MSIHISCDMYLRLGLHVQIRQYYVLPYKAKMSAQHRTCFILDRCIVYLGLTMHYLQKKRLLIFELFNIKKCTFFFLEPSIFKKKIIVLLSPIFFPFFPSLRYHLRSKTTMFSIQREIITSLFRTLI